MMKKIMFANLLFLASTQIASANFAPYIAGGIGITNNTNGWDNFRGLPFNLYAGYGGDLTPNFYIAGELTGTIGTVRLTDHNDYGARSTFSYGVSLIPGLLLTDNSILFGRLGITRTRFSWSDPHDWFDWEGENLTGGVFGIGLQSNLTQNIDIRGEYNYIDYWTSAIRSDVFNFSLIYKFD